MADYTIEQHENGFHYIHWTDGRRSRRVSTRTKVKAEAQTFLAHWILGAKEDKLDASALLTVDDLWQQYFTRHVEKNNVGTRAAKTRWRNLSVHFAALKLPEVEGAVDEYIEHRETGQIGDCPGAPATIRHELAILKACFNWCAGLEGSRKQPRKDAIIKPEDVPVFDLPPDSEGRDRWLRDDEIKRMMKAAVEKRDGPRLSRIERFLWLALETAARLMAILELTWDRVDFEMGVIHYNVPGRRRTKKRRASVPISKNLRPILERAYRERESNYVCDHLAMTIWRGVKSVAKLAEVEDVSPHVLRHTAATQMLRRGVPIWIVAGILADTVETVQKTYGHHCPEGLAVGVEQISGSLLEPAE